MGRPLRWLCATPTSSGRPLRACARAWLLPEGRYALVWRRRNGLHRLNTAGNERRLRFADSVVDRDAGSFVEDLNTEDLGSRHGAVLVGTGEGDVERQHLVGIPRSGKLVERADFGQRNASSWSMVAPIETRQNFGDHV